MTTKKKRSATKSIKVPKIDLTTPEGLLAEYRRLTIAQDEETERRLERLERIMRLLTRHLGLKDDEPSDLH